MSVDWWSMGTFVLWMAGVVKHGVTFKEPQDPLSLPINVTDGLLNHNLNSTTIFPKPSPQSLNPLHGSFTKTLDAQKLFAQSTEFICPGNKRFDVFDVSRSTSYARQYAFIQQETVHGGKQNVVLFPKIVGEQTRSERAKWKWDANFKECNVQGMPAATPPPPKKSISATKKSVGNKNTRSSEPKAVFRPQAKTVKTTQNKPEEAAIRFKQEQEMDKKWTEQWEKLDAERKKAEKALSAQEGRAMTADAEEIHPLTQDGGFDIKETSASPSSFSSSSRQSDATSNDLSKSFNFKPRQSLRSNEPSSSHSFEPSTNDASSFPATSFDSVPSVDFNDGLTSAHTLQRRTIWAEIDKELSKFPEDNDKSMSMQMSASSSASKTNNKKPKVDDQPVVYEYPILKEFKKIDLKFKDGQMKIATGPVSTARAIIVKRGENAYFCGVVGVSTDQKTGTQTWERCLVNKASTKGRRRLRH
ncbi:hypothetical protein BKA69DRAFT_1059354 [Paraphysoderma sedebokerense]|nr:hypothetical protein BKA69DRAFT_1059354 [Paraphysoderma sedebokerense]